MDLAINSIIFWEKPTEVRERVLWIDANSGQVATIKPETRRAIASLRRLSEIEQCLTEGLCTIVAPGPNPGDMAEERIPEAHRQKRDRAWKIIAPLVENLSIKLFDSHTRGLLVNAVASENRIHKRFVYKYLRRYFQGGMTKNALIP